MSKKIGLFTIASKNYLAYVRTLLSSVAEIHPEYELYLCLVDRVDGYFDPANEPYKIVPADAIGIPTFKDMALRYDIMEFNTAVKPYMFRWMFENTDLDAVIYLDPDICAYSRLEQLEGVLAAGASVVLTPHITQPLEDGKNPNDYHMLQSGVFNLGFIAMRRCREALDFIGWWGRRLATQAVADFKNNLFTDQRWCDLAPCFLENLHVLRNPGYNVAYWNLAQRPVQRDKKKLLFADGVPLAFFHFSGVSADKENVISKHQDRLDWEEIPQCHALFNQYRNALVANGWNETKTWPYAYSSFSTELSMKPIIRLLYQRVYPNSIWSVPDDIASFVITLCNTPAEGVLQNSDAQISRLMYLIYQIRPDLQSAFNLQAPQGREEFVSWFGEAGEREYDLPSCLTQFQPATAVTTDAGISASPPATAVEADIPTTTSEYRALKRLEEFILRPIWRHLPNNVRLPTGNGWKKLLAYSLTIGREVDVRVPINSWGPTNGDRSEYRSKIDFLNDPADTQQLLSDQFVSNLMYMIWRSRPDLQQVFDLATEAGQSGFASWYEVSVEREYGLSPVVPRCSASSWERTGMRTSSDARIHQIESKTQSGGKPGANLIGYAHAELGMGEHVRMTAAALANTKVQYGVVNFNVGVSSRQRASLSHGNLSTGSNHAANIFHINADQMLRAYCHLGRDFFASRYNIGYWAWELAKCPDDWVPVLGMVDEVWAPSRFIQQAFSERTNVPVRYMPLCVTLPTVKPFTRKHFGLSDDAFLFLYTFDFLSYLDRKNPFAAIRAFKQAFPSQTTRAALVLKIMNGDTEDKKWLSMMELIDGDPRIIVINKTLDRDEVIGLFNVCDCFVSLHRSEGFGRGPAEAMYLGKPVIVTNYSGNTDFTLPDNSCLVDYQLISVGSGQYPFHESQVWAEPDVGHAAWFMKKIANDSAFSRAIGAKARRFIHSNFSQDAIGAIYAKRLEALGLA